MLLDPSVFAMTVAALHYYLPAYLLAVLNYDWFDAQPLLNALYTHEMPAEASPSQFWWREISRWEELMKRLTIEQKRAIRLWLEFLTERSRVSGGHEHRLKALTTMLAAIPPNSPRH
ncbi:MAG TPA: hypothetical protein VE621_11115 [Bryobacteraceae bacterium]|jgi:hypothetical protein|nr:hypothetical protein [Bryobacteraceae bacterium]